MDNPSNEISFYDLHPTPLNVSSEILSGLSRRPKHISPKYLYDEHGSRLFDKLCDTSDYYPTRTEKTILEQNMEDIINHIDQGCILVEPGSGNSKKIRQLLDPIQPEAYFPMDISKDYLKQEASKLATEFPWLDVHAVCADFTGPVEIPPLKNDKPKVAFFPGSSIGNFEPDDAVDFLTNVADIVQPGGGLLIGVDLKKETSILNAAYNDSEGLTAAFNLNILKRINRDLQADFNLEKFAHHAFYNENKGRVEMHLVSKTDQDVEVAGATFNFQKNESIHTENSYKYNVQEFQELAQKAGFDAQTVWTDSNDLFSVHYLAATED